MLNAGHADGVGAHPIYRFQVFGVHEQPGKLVLIQFQPEQNTQAHIVDAALHGPVHGFGVIIIIVLRARGM